MRKIVIVTTFATNKTIQKYKNIPLVGVEGGIKLIAENHLPIALGIGDFDTLGYEEALKYLKPNQIVRLNTKKDMSDTEAALDYMHKLGFDEIIILGSLAGRYDHSHALLLLTKKYSNLKITLEDDFNEISYLGKGSHVIQKQDYKYVGFFGFPEAIVSVENALYPMKKFKLDFTTTKAISNEVNERVCEIEVHKGGVLCVQSKEN